MNDTELRHKVALSCRIIGGHGLTPGAFGHVSVRVPDSDDILIKAKGPNESALEFATSADVLRIDLAGNAVEESDGLAPPGETPMHLAIYRARPEVTSVIHCHPMWVAVLTACEKPLVPMFGGFDGQAGMRLLEEGLPVYPRSVTVINDELAAEVVEVMGERRACLLRGHGITVAGNSVEAATETCLNLNQLAYANYLGYAIGGPLPVPDIKDHRARFARAGGKRKERGTNAHGPSLWRYHVELLEKEGLT
jgi:ribulose-5-phosphate 4-epimerase/fuculose-1-phosphate aldolase